MDNDYLVARLGHVVSTLEALETPPKPYDLYYAVKNDGNGTGWSYICAGIGMTDLRALFDRYRTAMSQMKSLEEGERDTFQSRVKPWMMACFGEKISADKIERNHRFLEEALELVQSKGCTREEAHLLVDYVYGRDQGDVNQEVGGVMVTLAALCLASGVDMHECGEKELERIWGKVEQIRDKQANKPKHSPLPQHTDTQTLIVNLWKAPPNWRDVLVEICAKQKMSWEEWEPQPIVDQIKLHNCKNIPPDLPDWFSFTG